MNLVYRACHHLRGQWPISFNPVGMGRGYAASSSSVMELERRNSRSRSTSSIEWPSFKRLGDVIDQPGLNQPLALVQFEWFGRQYLAFEADCCRFSTRFSMFSRIGRSILDTRSRMSLSFASAGCFSLSSSMRMASIEKAKAMRSVANWL
jgi:hypothetical protein